MKFDKFAHMARIQMKRLRRFSLLLLTLFIYTGCETDFDVNADWKDITIVYGLLSQGDTTHFVKINKAFLGDANAYDMAQIRDSSEYKSISVIVEEYQDDVKIGEYHLQDTLINNKSTTGQYGDEGIFYAPEQTLYYFTDPSLNQNSRYKLVVTIGENEKQVTAETELVDDFLFTFPPKGFPVSFATSTDYVSQSIKWVTAKDAKRYDALLIFYYDDWKVSGADTIVVPRSIQWGLETKKSFDTDGGKEMKLTLNGEEFYQLVANKVLDITEEPDVIKRWPRDVEIIVTVAGDDLNTYIEVNSPSTGIVQERPEFTNVDNGIGIWSTRYKKIEVREFSKATLTELVNGDLSPYTAAKGFCHPGLPNTFPTSCHQ